MPEQGRIRLGVKTERAMKAIDTFRFTSKDYDAIYQLSNLYGGEIDKWTPPRSKEQQWEIITRSSEIRVFLPQNSIDVWYEEWSGGGLVRRCDGLNAQVEVQTPDGTDIDMVPCHCSQQVELNRPMSCDPHTRLNVILPDIRFGGTWRLESKGWNASKELPAMSQVITQMQAMGIVEGVLSLEKRTKKSGGQTRNFVVPKLSMNTSPLEIMQGKAIPKVQEVPKPAALIATVVDAEVVNDGIYTQTEVDDIIGEGWDVPPPNTNVKKNPNPPPKWLPV